jgi:predicted nucleic acid-binding protein
MTTFFDTSALIALTKDTEQHHAWSLAEYEAGRGRGPIVINPVVFAEYCAAYPTLDEVRKSLRELGIEILTDEEIALFRASRAYRKYKDDNNGPKNSLYPDFLIGAAAETTGRPLVTLNERDFTKYFDRIALIHPVRT